MTLEKKNTNLQTQSLEKHPFTRNSDYTTHLKKLQGLPIIYRFEFKICSLTYKSFYSLAPAYISNNKFCHSAISHHFTMPNFLQVLREGGFLMPLCFYTRYFFWIRCLSQPPPSPPLLPSPASPSSGKYLLILWGWAKHQLRKSFLVIGGRVSGYISSNLLHNSASYWFHL